MAKYLDAKCRLCRREGAKLFLKAERCLGNKCPLEKKGALPPGQHGQKGRKKMSEYGLRLREKQKAKRIYGVLEKQFKHYFEMAAKKKEATGEALLVFLERRLDNVLYRLGFAPSRIVARQIISHKHVFVNGKKINIVSYLVKPEDTISLSSKAMEMPIIKKILESKIKPPAWLDKKAAVGKVLRYPKREEIENDINEQLIVEFYSR